MSKLNDIKAALTRKLGPLPVWAWAIIVGGALYVYRARHAVGDNTSALPSTDTTVPTTDNGQPRPDPVTLQPGESVYDPATGSLLGTAPDQQPPPDPQEPVTLDPGESVYDPNTGQVVGGSEGPTGTDPTAPATAPKSKPTFRTVKGKDSKGRNGKWHVYPDGHRVFVPASGKRAPKSKAHRGKTAHPPSNGRSKARSNATVKHSTHTNHSTHSAPKPRAHSGPTRGAPSRARKPAPKPRHAVVRQHPAPRPAPRRVARPVATHNRRTRRR